MVRPLPGRVYRDDDGTLRGARKRNAAEHGYLESAGRQATPKRPAYTYDGGKIQVYPGSDPTVEISYVSRPSRIGIGDIPEKPFYEPGTDDLDVGSQLLGPLVLYVTAKASRPLERIGAHNLYMTLYERTLRPLSRTWRIGRESNYQRGRTDEQEVHMEV